MKIKKLNHSLKIKNWNLIVVCILVIGLLVIAKTNVFAQSAMGLSAIPPRIEVTVKPGKTVTHAIKVRNESKIDQIISVTTKDFIVTNNEGTPVQLDEKIDSKNNRWTASSWIQVSEDKVKLKPGETKSLVATVIAPENAIPGGHYAMILYTPLSGTVLNENGASIQTQVGSLVYVTVPGNIKQNAIIKDFFAPKFSEFGPINFKATIENLSDIHIAPIGSINITNWLGGKTASLTLDKTNIFPYTSRDFTNSLQKKWLFGRYKAQFQAGYGTTGNALIATTIFWVIPWRLLSLLAAAIAIIIALILLNRKKPQDQNPALDKNAEKILEELKNKYKDSK